MGVILKGYSLSPNTSPNLFDVASVAEDMESEIGDIRNISKLTKSMKIFDPDIVIHMAAQPLVRLSYEKPIETYETNVMGTMNVLEVARQCKNLTNVMKIQENKMVMLRLIQWVDLIHTVAVKVAANC